MAIVLRPCIVCTTQFNARTSRAQFCSSTCKSINHRNKQRQLIDLNKINTATEDQTMKEQQQEEARVARVREYVLRWCHCMTVSQLAVELGVSERFIELYYPKRNR